MGSQQGTVGSSHGGMGDTGVWLGWGGTEVLGDATPLQGDWEGLADEMGDRGAEKGAEEVQKNHRILS